MAKSLGRYRCTDMIGVRPVRVRDQEEQEGEGELLCRLAQTGADRWHGTDGAGRRLAIRRISDGSLEIRHLAEEQPSGDNGELENVVGSAPRPGGGDPGRAAVGDALSEYRRTQDPTRHLAALGSYQEQLDRYYGTPRR